MLRPIVDIVALALATIVVLRWPGEAVPVDDVVRALPADRDADARPARHVRATAPRLDPRRVAPVISAVSLAVMLLAVFEVYVVRDDPGSAVLAHTWVATL